MTTAAARASAPPRRRRPLPLHRVRHPRDLLRLDRLAVLRVVLVACQATQIAFTWRLWQHRTVPPTLPVLTGLPVVSVGWILLASLLPVVLRPRWGIPVHVGLLTVALLLDQMRLQPEWVGLAVLLVAGGRWRTSPTLAWSWLSAMWLWAGLTKALSPGFTTATVVPIVDRFGVPGLRPLVAVAIPAIEITVGLAAAWPRTRRAAGWAGLGLHLGILVAIDHNLDSPIIPWNIGLAAASVLLLALGPAERPARTRQGAGARAALVALLFVAPATSYLGLLDPYLSHHTYTGGMSRAELCFPDGRCDPWAINLTAAVVQVPFPGSDRLYRQWFQEICEPGQRLRITGLRVRPPLDRLPGADDHVVPCHRTGP